MAFKTKDDLRRKIIIPLVLYFLPWTIASNIDCSGQAFHCVNSTHFMICVDLGGGVTSTIDNFLIPCPPTTECHANNRFECEFTLSSSPKSLTTTHVTNEVNDLNYSTKLQTVTDSTRNADIDFMNVIPASPNTYDVMDSANIIMLNDILPSNETTPFDEISAKTLSTTENVITVRPELEFNRTENTLGIGDWSALTTINDVNEINISETKSNLVITTDNAIYEVTTEILLADNSTDSVLNYVPFTESITTIKIENEATAIDKVNANTLFTTENIDTAQPTTDPGTQIVNGNYTDDKLNRTSNALEMWDWSTVTSANDVTKINETKSNFINTTNNAVYEITTEILLADNSANSIINDISAPYPEMFSTAKILSEIAIDELSAKLFNTTTENVNTVQFVSELSTDITSGNYTDYEFNRTSIILDTMDWTTVTSINDGNVMNINEINSDLINATDNVIYEIATDITLKDIGTNSVTNEITYDISSSPIATPSLSEDVILFENVTQVSQVVEITKATNSDNSLLHLENNIMVNETVHDEVAIESTKPTLTQTINNNLHLDHTMVLANVPFAPTISPVVAITTITNIATNDNNANDMNYDNKITPLLMSEGDKILTSTTILDESSISQIRHMHEVSQTENSLNIDLFASSSIVDYITTTDDITTSDIIFAINAHDTTEIPINVTLEEISIIDQNIQTDQSTFTTPDNEIWQLINKNVTDIGENKTTDIYKHISQSLNENTEKVTNNIYPPRKEQGYFESTNLPLAMKSEPMNNILYNLNNNANDTDVVPTETEATKPQFIVTDTSYFEPYPINSVKYFNNNELSVIKETNAPSVTEQSIISTVDLIKSDITSSDGIVGANTISPYDVFVYSKSYDRATEGSFADSTLSQEKHFVTQNKVHASTLTSTESEKTLLPSNIQENTVMISRPEDTTSSVDVINTLEQNVNFNKSLGIGDFLHFLTTNEPEPNTLGTNSIKSVDTLLGVSEVLFVSTTSIPGSIALDANLVNNNDTINLGTTLGSEVLDSSITNKDSLIANDGLTINGVQQKVTKSSLSSSLYQIDLSGTTPMSDTRTEKEVLVGNERNSIVTKKEIVDVDITANLNDNLFNIYSDISSSLSSQNIKKDEDINNNAKEIIIGTIDKDSPLVSATPSKNIDSKMLENISTTSNALTRASILNINTENIIENEQYNYKNDLKVLTNNNNPSKDMRAIKGDTQIIDMNENVTTMGIVTIPLIEFDTNIPFTIESGLRTSTLRPISDKNQHDDEFVSRSAKGGIAITTESSIKNTEPNHVLSVASLKENIIDYDDVKNNVTPSISISSTKQVSRSPITESPEENSTNYALKAITTMTQPKDRRELVSSTPRISVSESIITTKEFDGQNEKVNISMPNIPLNVDSPIDSNSDDKRNASNLTQVISNSSIKQTNIPINEKTGNEISTRNQANVTDKNNKNILNPYTLEEPKNSFFYCPNHNRGRYSDNHDCRKFYICIGKQQPIIGKCPQNTVFSEIRKQCTNNLSHCVRQNQFQCVTTGRFTDYFYDNIYYICIKNAENTFIRYKLQCQSGYTLNKTSIACIYNTDSSSQSSSKDSNTNSGQSASSMISEKQLKSESEKQKFVCTTQGKFPDPEDRRKYYVCTTNNRSEIRKKMKRCDSDEVFHKEKKKCVDSDSYEY